MTPGIGGERLGNDPFPVVQGHAHRRGRGIKTHHKHVAQPSGRAVSLSQTAGYCSEASAAWANARAADVSWDCDTGP